MKWTIYKCKSCNKEWHTNEGNKDKCNICKGIINIYYDKINNKMIKEINIKYCENNDKYNLFINGELYGKFYKLNNILNIIKIRGNNNEIRNL